LSRLRLTGALESIEFGSHRREPLERVGELDRQGDKHRRDLVVGSAVARLSTHGHRDEGRDAAIREFLTSLHEQIPESAGHGGKDHVVHGAAHRPLDRRHLAESHRRVCPHS
jgi:hypothetical protein